MANIQYDVPGWWNLPGYVAPGGNVNTGGGGDSEGHGPGTGGPPGAGGAGGKGGAPWGDTSGVSSGAGGAATAATGTPWYMNPSIWNNLVNAAVGVYGLGRGSGSTPNTYPVPLTPGEEWAQSAKKNLFDYGSSYVDQYLRGLGDLNPAWSPNSSLLGPNGGGGFMGGVKVPTIDWSKMPQRPSATGTPTGAGTPGTPGTVTIDDIRKNFGEDGVRIAQLVMNGNPGLSMATVFSIVRTVLSGNSGGGDLNPGLGQRTP